MADGGDERHEREQASTTAQDRQQVAELEERELSLLDFEIKKAEKLQELRVLQRKQYDEDRSANSFLYRLYKRLFRERPREDSRYRIASYIIRMFVIFIFWTFLLIFYGLFLASVGSESEWKQAVDIMIEIIKIAFLPVVMLVLGFYFGKPGDMTKKD